MKKKLIIALFIVSILLLTLDVLLHSLKIEHNHKNSFFDRLFNKNIVTLPEMKFAGVKFPCVNRNLIDTSFKDISAAVIKLGLANIKNIDGKLYNGIINPSEDYKKDRINGKYDCFVAFQVESFEGLPNNLTTLHLKSAKYKIFKTRTGNLQEVVLEKWHEEIWGDEKLSSERSYIFDFDVYTGKEDFNNASVDIYIGIK